MLSIPAIVALSAIAVVGLPTSGFASAFFLSKHHRLIRNRIIKSKQLLKKLHTTEEVVSLEEIDEAIESGTVDDLCHVLARHGTTDPVWVSKMFEEVGRVNRVSVPVDPRAGSASEDDGSTCENESKSVLEDGGKGEVDEEEICTRLRTLRKRLAKSSGGSKYLKYLVNGVKRKHCNLRRTESNRLMVQHLLSGQMVEDGLRASHAAKYLPMALELCFVPTKYEIAAKDIVQHSSVREHFFDFHHAGTTPWFTRFIEWTGCRRGRSAPDWVKE